MIEWLSNNKEFVTILGTLATAAGAVIKHFWNVRSERKTLEGAFLVEIDRLLDVIERHKGWWERIGQKNGDPLIPITTDFYDRQIENVGTLDKQLARKVVRFYGDVKFLNHVQQSRAEHVVLGKKMEKNFKALYSHWLREVWKKCSHQFDEEFGAYGIVRKPQTPPAKRVA